MIMKNVVLKLSEWNKTINNYIGISSFITLITDGIYIINNNSMHKIVLYIHTALLL